MTLEGLEIGGDFSGLSRPGTDTIPVLTEDKGGPDVGPSKY